MKNNNDTKGISIAELRTNLPFLFLLTAIILSYAGLTTQIALLGQKTDTTNAQVLVHTQQIEKISDNANALDRRVIRLESVVESNQASGKLSKSDLEISNNLSLAQGPVADDSAQVSPEPKKEKKTDESITPTPKPTPTPVIEIHIPIIERLLN